MRIQEMKSGLSHLPRKREKDGETDSPETDAAEAVAGVNPLEMAAAVAVEEAGGPAAAEAVAEGNLSSGAVECELDKPIWAVVSFEQMEVGGLTFNQAVEMINELDSVGVTGLCIVSLEAALRLGSQNSRTTFPKLSLEAK
jgi:hypothetical protein